MDFSLKNERADRSCILEQEREKERKRDGGREKKGGRKGEKEGWREGDKEGRREREREISGASICMYRQANWVLNHNLGMCPDYESIFEPTEPRGRGPHLMSATLRECHGDGCLQLSPGAQGNTLPYVSKRFTLPLQVSFEQNLEVIPAEPANLNQAMHFAFSDTKALGFLEFAVALMTK